VKKFLVLFHESWDPTPEAMAAWQAWFASIGDRLVDSGNPLANGLEVMKSGSRALTAEMGPATGYTIISAADHADAARLLEGCPAIAAIRLYEAMAM
jgi:hypothetical protein